MERTRGGGRTGGSPVPPPDDYDGTYEARSDVELVLLVAMFVAAGAVALSALKRALSGGIDPSRCPSCGEIVGRAYSNCRHCGARL